MRGGNEGWSSPPPVPVTYGPQHGAYFEVREVRVWYAPWRKRQVWQQISAWQQSPPPAGVEAVVTVPHVAALPGTVHTIGTPGENGTVVY